MAHSITKISSSKGIFQRNKKGAKNTPGAATLCGYCLIFIYFPREAKPATQTNWLVFLKAEANILPNMQKPPLLLFTAFN
ncbi:MAG: hypothetical protein CMQ00_07250 [Gammaproteobacteria bacterium]|nr:hypothetical protein [Gammaproteobacteria bacterium]OUV75233.1 MAG: hypothetical protein CBC99_05855 [Gammaproteobacteria bacterium TMED139]